MCLQPRFGDCGCTGDDSSAPSLEGPPAHDKVEGVESALQEAVLKEDGPQMYH